MRLYHRPDCPFCWKVRIFLHEAQTEIEEVFVEFGKKHPDVVSLNPNARVPVLIEGDLVIYESALIIEYLSDMFPQSALMHGSPLERANIRQLHSYSDNKVGKALFPYIKHVRENQGCSVDEELKRTTLEAWVGIQEKLSNSLGDKDFFSADFSVAECALIPRFTIAITYGLHISHQFPNLLAWYERCKKRESFITTLPRSFPGIK